MREDEQFERLGVTYQNYEYVVVMTPQKLIGVAKKSRVL